MAIHEGRRWTTEKVSTLWVDLDPFINPATHDDPELLVALDQTRNSQISAGLRERGHRLDMTSKLIERLSKKRKTIP